MPDQNSKIDPNLLAILLKRKVAEFLASAKSEGTAGVTGLKDLVTTNPVTTAKGLYEAQMKPWERAGVEYATGNKTDAAIHAANGLVPGVGPWVDDIATEIADTGNYAKGAGRTVGGAVVGELTGKVGGAATDLRLGHLMNDESGILRLDSPLRSPAVRAAKATQLLEGTSKLPSHISDQVKVFLQKYPRLASHLDSIGPVSDTMTTGEFIPTATGGSINLHPGLTNATPAIAHEGTHLAQNLRVADRARRAGTDSAQLGASAAQQSAPLPFDQKYQALLEDYGYFNHPMERAARTTEVLSTIPKAGNPAGNAARLATAARTADSLPAMAMRMDAELPREAIEKYHQLHQQQEMDKIIQGIKDSLKGLPSRVLKP